MELIRTNPVVKIETQRDDFNAWTLVKEPYNHCMCESFTAIMQWLRQAYLIDGKPCFENYTEHTHYIVVGETPEKVGSVRFNSANHVKKLNNMLATYKNKIPYRFVPGNLNLDQVKQIVREKNRPVLVGTLLTDCGHIVAYDGLWQDPYGHAEHQIRPGNAVYKNINGSDSDYPDDFAKSMIFRSFKWVDTGRKDPKGKPVMIQLTDKINQTRPCWYLEKI